MVEVPKFTPTKDVITDDAITGPQQIPVDKAMTMAKAAVSNHSSPV